MESGGGRPPSDGRRSRSPRLQPIRKQSVQQAMERMARGLGGREGLEHIGGIFKEMDADNSGELSKDEFVNGVRKTSLELDDDEIDGIFGLLDVNGDGGLSLTEFERLVKIELECVDLQDTLSEFADRKDPTSPMSRPRLINRRESAIIKAALVKKKMEDVRIEAARAAKRGARFTRTASIAEGDLKRQGALEMLSSENVKKRAAIKDNIAVLQAAQQW